MENLFVCKVISMKLPSLRSYCTSENKTKTKSSNNNTNDEDNVKKSHKNFIQVTKCKKKMLIHYLMINLIIVIIFIFGFIGVTEGNLEFSLFRNKFYICMRLG